MGSLTRSATRANNSYLIDPAIPRKLHKGNPRQKRVESTSPGNATVILSAHKVSAWEEPVRALARPSWANADDDFDRAPNEHLRTMKPIGQYPSLAEYKSVGLRPRSKTWKTGIKRASKLYSRTDDDEDLTTDTPITPVAEEEAIAAEILRADDDDDDDDDTMNGVETTARVKTAVEGVVMEVEDTDAEAEDMNETNLATPVSEAVDPSSAFPSIHQSINPSTQPSAHSSIHSTLNSPVDTPLEEINSPVLTLTAPTTHLTVPGSQFPTSHRHLQQTQSPPATAVATMADTMVSKDQQVVKPDYLAVLNSLPVPRSEKYDVNQLKHVLEVAVTRAVNISEDDVALSLVHYWSEISGDDFKLSLVHNIGNDERDHNLELALQTMLRHSTDEASKWYQTYAAENSRLLAGPGSPTDSSLSSAKSLEPESTTFSRADIYRDTSGPKLEEAFLSGKTNTAPLKRAKKPCRVNENSFKRRREWEADSTLEDSLRDKRARLAQGAKSDLTLADSSSVRPQRGQPDDIQHPYSYGGEEQDENMLSTPRAATTEAATPEATTPSGVGQPRRQRIAKERSKAKGKEAEKEREKEKDKDKENEKQLSRGARSLSLDTTVSGAESDASNSCYSDNENSWVGDYKCRQMPNAINVPENTDYCTICDDEGDLLCCDTCENAFHFGCLRPRVDKKNPPKGDWFCETCVVRNSLTTTIAWGKHKRRKSSYSPPQGIKDYFEGVGEEIRGNTHYPPEEKRTYSFYKSVPTMPRLTKPPKTDKDHSNRTPLYDDPNLTKLMENGHVILCNKCGLSSEGTRPIIRCDYCESRFHLDCLDPPMAKPPNPYEGWLCPNHVTSDDLVVRKHVNGQVQERRPRRPKKATTLSHRWDPEQTWDEDFTAQDDDVGSREIVLDFISTAKFNKKREDEQKQKQLESTMLDLTRHLTMEHFTKNGVSLADISNPNPQLRAGIKSLLHNYDSGRYNLATYDAASSLLGLSNGEPVTIDDEPVTASISAEKIAVAPVPSQQDEPVDLETPQKATSPKPDEKDTPAPVPSPAPAPGTASRPLARSAPASRRQSRSRRITNSPRETRKKKRSYAESEPSLSADEPALKRQHADSD
ncbi:hypothetical protein N7509_011156 [Penicillium cosmopolitanum]|uniref:PHD-type domain-containing protein n=1 Tax=Penicillium cosmopolitanum TaxID=1131564 RepID=A0A9W9VT18_9EURO|nr:uncharacterized protein N7509_011156 [Penicillium cosmopolitanum]KAJ5388615.1 hypothetical protein N7509_011156 [Penicillium cosmopolitanum]